MTLVAAFLHRITREKPQTFKPTTSAKPISFAVAILVEAIYSRPHHDDDNPFFSENNESFY